MRRWMLLGVCALCLAALGAVAPPAGKTQTITIKADGPLEIDWAKRTGTASGNALLTTPDGTIAADKMDFTLDEKSAIENLTATGHVVIKAKTTTKEGVERRIDAHSDLATLQQKDHLLTLTSNTVNPVTGQIVEPAKQRTIDLTSKVATIWLNENKVRLEGASVTITQPEQAPAAGSAAAK